MESLVGSVTQAAFTWQWFPGHSKQNRVVGSQPQRLELLVQNGLRVPFCVSNLYDKNVSGPVW